MTIQSFDAQGTTRQGYLALPASGEGPGILVLHAWWGLNEVFKSLCDRLAAEGYVAFAPDLHHGVLTSLREEAQKIIETRDFPTVQATAEAGLAFLLAHPAVIGQQLGAIGFSMGGSFALLLDSLSPHAFKAIVIFYDDSDGFSKSHARFLCHYAEQDEFVPLDFVKKIRGDNVDVQIYPGTRHWFFEENRPDSYDEAAAKLAWERTLTFFKEQLSR
jgi:carboxymethylenebutenolidase